MPERCEECQKGSYKSLNRINAVILERVRDGAPPLRPYRCPYHKGRYHMTSKWYTYNPAT